MSINRVTPQDGYNNSNYSPFLTLHVHKEGSGLETVPWCKREMTEEKEMGFGLMSWHTHPSLNGQRWQGSIIVERAASLLPVLSLRALVRRRIQLTADKGKEKHMKTKDIYKASSGAKTLPSPPTHTRTTHRQTHMHTHAPQLRLQASTQTGTSPLYLHTLKFPPAWLANWLLHLGLLGRDIIDLSTNVKAFLKWDFKNYPSKK